MLRHQFKSKEGGMEEPYMEKKIIHYPNLKTVLMVEEIIKNAEEPITRTEIKQKLEKKIMHQTLNIIIEYLENSGKIYDGRKGVVWIYNPSPKLQEAIKHGREL